jgi:hypothetical protein
LIISIASGKNFVFPLTLAQVEEIRERLGEKAGIISEFASPLGEELNSVSNAEILNLIKRRPCTTEDISRALGLRVNEVIKHLDDLTKTGGIRYRIYQHRCYYENALSH